jgi:hypothetical protein
LDQSLQKGDENKVNEDVANEDLKIKEIFNLGKGDNLNQEAETSST